jgi:hypothetical protein
MYFPVFLWFNWVKKLFTHVFYIEDTSLIKVSYNFLSFEKRNDISLWIYLWNFIWSCRANYEGLKSDYTHSTHCVQYFEYQTKFMLVEAPEIYFGGTFILNEHLEFGRL